MAHPTNLSRAIDLKLRYSLAPWGEGWGEGEKPTVSKAAELRAGPLAIRLVGMAHPTNLSRAIDLKLRISLAPWGEGWGEGERPTVSKAAGLRKPLG